MHEIRKNNVEEYDIIKMEFKYEKTRIILDIVGILICAGFVAIAAAIGITDKNNILFAIIFGAITGFCFVAYTLGMFFKIIGCKKSEVTVTNRRIHGKYGPYLVKKAFSYRLDEIDNVEYKTTLGAKSIIINFQDGKGPRSSPQVSYSSFASQAMAGLGVLRLLSVKNCQEVYEALTKRLLELKSNTDLETDIAMAKVDVESRKADAIEKIANNTVIGNEPKKSNMSYIDEIKELKKLLDEGAITKEEFEQEKKEILSNNH